MLLREQKLIVTLIYEISQFDWAVSPSCEGVKVFFNIPSGNPNSSKYEEKCFL